MPIPRDAQLACTACGGTFFYVQRAEQFSAGGYGSAEFRSTSNAPKTVLVCLCGQPVTPKPGYYTRGTVASVAEDEFRKSVEAAQKHRDASAIEHIAEIAASPSEVQEVRDDITEIRKAIVAMANPPVMQLQEEPPKSPEPKPKKTKAGAASRS